MQKDIEDKVGQLDQMVVKTPLVINVRNNVPRIGNFTSSEIVALTKKGKKDDTWGVPALTYIEETNMERRLQRSLSDECSAHPLIWGKFLEPRVNEIIGQDYHLCSTETLVHPSIDYWSGSPDGFKFDQGKTVTDIKCPLTLKSFCQLVDPIYEGLTGMDAMQAIREKHKDGEKFYWQLVSNSILSSSQFAELIVYMPYASELPEIQLMAAGVPDDLLSKHYWIASAGQGELPFILDGGYYKNVNVIRFEVPDYDKKLLTNYVLKAGELLNPKSSGLMATYKPELGATVIESIPLIKI